MFRGHSRLATETKLPCDNSTSMHLGTGTVPPENTCMQLTQSIHKTANGYRLPRRSGASEMDPSPRLQYSIGALLKNDVYPFLCG